VGHAARHGLAAIPSTIQAWLNNWKYKQKITVDVLNRKFAHPGSPERTEGNRPESGTP
jgi:hypothetical protein